MCMESDITTYIAIYGAILSSLAIIWNIIKDINDKVKVKVTANIGFETGISNTPREIYIFEAVNIGKRPVTLTNAGIRVENKSNVQFIQNNNLPKKLKEGETVSFFRYANEFYDEIKDHKAKYLWFRDTQGKTYKSKNTKKLFSTKYHED